MNYTTRYILIAVSALTLTVIAGSSFLYGKKAAGRAIADTIAYALAEALQEELDLRLASMGGYATPEPKPDRKVKTYRSITEEKDTTYVFEDSIDLKTADFLINQHELAVMHPMDINKASIILSEKLTALHVTGANGIAYTYNGKTTYSANDSVSPAKATYCMPAKYIDYPPSILVQAWTDYGMATLWHYTETGYIWIAAVCLLGIVLLGWKYGALRKQASALKIKINEGQQTCIIEGVTHRTKRQNLQILTMFLEAENYFLTRETIKQRFWKNNANPESADKNLNTHINEIRQILRQHEKYDLITHKGKGYTLIMPE